MSILIWCIFSVLSTGLKVSSAQTVTGDYRNSTPMLDSEKQAFYSVLESLSGDLDARDLYPDPCGFTPVPGTLCDQFGDFWYITVFNIGNVYDNSPKCGDNAVLHPSIFNLTHLKTLSLYKCFMNAPQIMPLNQWGNLGGSLQSLIFRNNVALVGELPVELGRLVNLESLIVTENSMKGNLPNEIGNLTKLRKLVLSHNQFYGMIPSSLGFLQGLVILDLSFNQLKSPLPPSLGNLNSLVKLDLSDNGLQAGIPGKLGELKYLTFLDLRNNQLHGNLPPSLMEMTSLQELYLGNNPMGGPIDVLHWSNMPLLISLDLSSSGYTGQIPESFGKLKMLRSLALNNNALSGKVPKELADLPNVGSLLLNNNNLSGTLEFPSKFYQKMGRYLSLWGNPGLCYPTEDRKFIPNGVGVCSVMVVAPGKAHDQTSLNSVAGSAVQSCRFRVWLLLSFLVSLPLLH